jgi:hypothetical protein
MYRPRRKRAYFFFTFKAAECLEARALLSNVAVTAANGNIQLTGDSGDHTFSASVVGGNLELAGSAGTEFTFDGTTAATVDVPLSAVGTIHRLAIDMPAGNDAITFDATNLGTIVGNVTVHLGNGTNSLTFSHATVDGKVSVLGGSGADTIDLSNDTVRKIAICTGDGNDSVTLDTVTFQNSFSTSDSDSDTDGSLTGDGDFLADLIDSTLAAVQDLVGSLGPSLVVTGGNGNDTIHVTSVTGPTSSSSWLDNLLAGLGNQWQIFLGSGTNSVTLDSDQAPRSVSVLGITGNDTVDVTGTTVGGLANVNFGLGQGQITVDTSTFNGPALLSTGFGGSSQSISVNDSTFNSVAAFTVPGSGANLDLETGGQSGPGTTFHQPIVVAMPGPSAVADFGSSAPNNTLAFDSFVSVFGGFPAATVNIASTTTIDNDKLFLFSADRVNV